MKSKKLQYAFFVIYGLLVATGPICMIYMTTPVDPGNVVLWLLLPYALLVSGGMQVIMKGLYPRLFLSGRYLRFALSVWGLAYAVDITALYIGHYFTSWHHLPHYLKNPFSPWLLLSTLSTSMLSALTMGGFFLWKFYTFHREQSRYEEAYCKRIEEISARLKGRIRMPAIKKMLGEARTLLQSDPDGANERIIDISTSLRHNLYAKPDNTCGFHDLPPRHWEAETSSTSAFISEKRWRRWRHLLMTGILAIICFGLMFEYPDEIFADTSHLLFTLLFFLILCGLIYANILFVFPYFLRKERQRLYGVLLASICVTLFVALNAISLSHGTPYNPFGVRMPWFLVPCAVAGNVMTFFLLMAGSAATVLLKRNILGKWRLSRLEARNAEMEFATLQHQINPHTLFNFLNNIAIMGYEDPAAAGRTLESLESLLDYISTDTSRTETTVEEEIRFIRNYLTLEQSSGRELDVEIRCADSLLPRHMPPLLLIPFVDNAVKHSRSVSAGRRIEIDFKEMEGGMLFLCRNSCPAVMPQGSGSKKKSGGIGIANTRRRLQLLFGSSELLSFERLEESFAVRMMLPAMPAVSETGGTICSPSVTSHSA